MRAIITLIMCTLLAFIALPEASEVMAKDLIALPKPGSALKAPLERTLRERSSKRDFSSESLGLQAVSDLLWAAYGVKDSRGGRIVASAGAVYPLEVYLAAARVKDLPAGLYKYEPHKNSLKLVSAGDILPQLASAAVEQTWMAGAAAALVLAGNYGKMAARYGGRAHMYVHMEAGHAAQNVYLAAAALGLGTTLVGAFSDEMVAKIAGLAPDEQPLGILPVGFISR